ncbi:MAG: hypothetical protein DHS20C15_04130 [Planctomycetota bacterium]|nr:MAG: hypothetical protein DHS20C15_04130 [Planctomycetota bacterium]
MSTEQAPHLTSLLSAFAHPIRLRILNLLHQGDLCVGDLVTLLEVPQPTVSRHLSLLREAELVVTRKDGLWVYCSLAEASSPFHAKLIDCLACCMQEAPELEQDLQRAHELAQAGGCCPLHSEEDGGRGCSSSSMSRASKCCD